LRAKGFWRAAGIAVDVDFEVDFNFNFNVKSVSPPAARADATYFCRNKSRQKCFTEHRRPACGRVPSGAHVWRESPNSLQSLRSFRSDMRRFFFRQPLRAYGGADGGVSQRPTSAAQWTLLYSGVGNST
jgi:hypothetical protein